MTLRGWIHSVCGFPKQGLQMGTKKNTNKKIKLSLYFLLYFPMESDTSITQLTNTFCTFWIRLWFFVRWAEVGGKNTQPLSPIQTMQQVMNKQRDYQAPLPDRLCSHVLLMHATVFQHWYSIIAAMWNIAKFYSSYLIMLLPYWAPSRFFVDRKYF